MGHPLRVKFASEIICEFLPPKNLEAQPNNNNVIILAPGLPSSPGKSSLLSFWSSKNYWVFLPRYRGCWESSGNLFENSPHLDIADIISEVQKPFTSISLKSETFQIQNPKITLIGCSFGGPAVILNSQNPMISKVIAISPVIDWNNLGPDEPKDEFNQFIDEGFGYAYRGETNKWDKLGKNGFYNPIDQLSKIDGSKILIVQGRLDQVTPLQPILNFSNKTNAQIYLLKNKKHLSLGQSSKFWTYLRIKKFINQ